MGYADDEGVEGLQIGSHSRTELSCLPFSEV